MSDTTTEVAPVQPDLDDGDHERMAHYVNKVDAVRSNVTGEPVVALCGKRWVPNRLPEKYPVCQTCAEILASLTK
ncbi:MAG TPA: DUF3039 domain-containing protein [Acidimicrobiales bacterium]|nr:DUF3039 domain-containing protein [Acidimicrobiales bacterium]